jgi:putative acetyltransferase
VFNSTQLRIRKATEADLEEILMLFVNTIEQVNCKDYSSDQIDAWKSSSKNFERWKSKLANQVFVVAELNQMIVGFCSFEAPDYLDVLYVHAQYQQKGIAQLLYSHIEHVARTHGCLIFRSEVSITAKVFFEKQGFIEETKQVVSINNMALTNFRMSKKIILPNEVFNLGG